MVLVSSTFSLVTGILYQMHVISSPANINLFSCLTACLRHQDCGGIIKYELENFKCEFVVDASVSGATASLLRTAYRLNTYGNKKLMEATTDGTHITISELDQLCRAANLLMPDYPTTKKEQTIVGLRNKAGCMAVDLLAQPDGSFQNSNGETADETLFVWASWNPSGGDQKCIKLCGKKFIAIDLECDRPEEVMLLTLFCV